MKKVIVTGGFGFIGKKITTMLNNNNLQVIILEHPNSKISNLNNLFFVGSKINETKIPIPKKSKIELNNENVEK